ncbi:MAG: EamA family transporter [Parcubacteria group bacterium]
MIVIGAYVLNLKEISWNIFSPFKELFGQTKNLILFIPIIFWTLSAIFDKIAVQNSSPLFYLTTLPIFITIITSIIMKQKSNNIIIKIKSNYFALIIISFLGLVMQIFYLTSIKNTPISYVSAVRSLDFLFSVGYGFILFKESMIKQRFIGAGFMVLGVSLLAFA